RTSRRCGMLSPQPAATKVQRSPWALAGWSCLFTMLGFPVHEAAHALVYFLNGTEFIMTLNRVLPEQETVVGLLAGPLSSLVLAWLGLWAVASGKLPPRPWASASHSVKCFTGRFSISACCSSASPKTTKRWPPTSWAFPKPH